MNKTKLNLSVVIPTYNRSELVERAIQSVAIQDSFDPLEIIVLDDAGFDDTQNMIERVQRKARIPIVYIKVPINVGPSRLRNLGIKMAKGEFIGFLDSDDVWTSNKLKVFVSELEKKPHLKIWTHKSGNQLDPEEINQLTEIVPFWKQLLKNHASCPCTIIRKDVNQLFSEDMKFNEDHELFTRITYHHELMLNHSVLTILNRRVNQVGGLSGNLWSMRMGEMLTYCKAASYNKKLIFLVPFLLSFSLLKHVRMITIILLRQKKLLKY